MTQLDILPQDDAFAFLTALIGAWRGKLSEGQISEMTRVLTDDYDEEKIAVLFVAQTTIAARLVEALAEVHGLPVEVVLANVGRSLAEGDPMS